MHTDKKKIMNRKHVFSNSGLTASRFPQYLKMKQETWKLMSAR